ncbi:MAG: DNA repair protein RecO [Gammaproteobacteria bacterium]
MRGGGGLRIERQPAFVLHSRPYRESSLLLELLTREHGRVAAVARSARASRKGLGSVLQPFQSLLVSWSGRGELKTLTAAERWQPLPPVSGERLFSALYLNELLLRALAPQDPHPPLYDAYALLLPGLAGAPDIEPLLRGFELGLLRELGYALELRFEADTGEVLEPQGSYVFDPSDGFLRLPGAERPERAYPGWALMAIAGADYGDPLTRALAKRLLREALAPVLGERPLRSREYFRRPRAAIMGP